MRLPKRTVRSLAAGLAAALLLPLHTAVSQPAQPPPPSASSAARTVHAAPDGSGDACRADAPCGLTAARDAAREVAGQGEVTVQLADGRYRMAEPLELTSEDSGRDGHRVTWRAAPGAEPVFDGGVDVSGWKETDPEKNIWTAPLPEGASGARQMYVDGKRAVRARSAPCGKDDCKVTDDGITGADGRFADFAHPEDLEAVTAVQWRDFRCGVAKARKEGETSSLTLDQPCWNNQALKTQTGWESASPSSDRYDGIDWFENAYELLGTPGQFYVDERKKTVSYVPREGEDLTRDGTAVLPRAEQLLTVKGTLDKPVTGLTFEGLGFEHTTWRRPDTADGYVSGQAGHYVDGAPTGTQPGHGEQYPRIRTAVEVTAARDITFRDGDWRHLGAGGLDMSGGTSDSTVERSTFTDLSGGAVFVGDTKSRPEDKRSRSRDNVVRRNEITHVAREFRDNVGIFGGYNDGLAIDHNTVTHLPYTAISVGWGWDFVGDKDVQRDVVVSHNRIHDHMRTLRDGAGIYTQGQSPGSKVYANDIDTAKSPTGNGIYHDERSRHWTTQNNVVWSITDHDLENTDVKWLSAWASWGGYNIARDNWTDDPRPGKSGTDKNTFAPNHLGLTALPSDAKKVVAAAGHDAPEEKREVRFVAPRGPTAEGITDIEVTAPYDTRTVRFSVDGTALSEMTRLYADGTGQDAKWKVAANADWLPPGARTLRAEAVTAQGTVTAERRITVKGDGDRSPGALNGTWKFAVEDELPDGALDGDTPPAARPGFDESAMTPIQVPSSFGAVRDKWNDHEGHVSAYRKTFRQPAGSGGSLSLVAESCFFECRYYVNGEHVGTSTGGYLPERLDITDAAREGDNQLTVLVDNRKKETIAPYAINQDLYWNWGGIQDEVRVERTGEAEITHVTAQGAADGTVELRASGVNATGGAEEVPARVRVAGLDVDRKVTFELPEGGAESDPVKLKADDPELWTLEKPRLYDVRVTPDDGGRTLTTRTGFRTVTAKDGEVLLNGHAVKNLKGFNRHADYPGLGRTDPAGLSRRELKKLHDDGFRLFRPGHYPTTPALLDAADELGFLVVEEINVTQAKKEQLASDKTRDFARDRLTRMIRRDRGHPSVVTWSVGNENHTQTDEGAAYVRDTIAYGRERDPSRLYTEVSAWHEEDKSYAYQDVILANIYAGWYEGELDDVAGLTDAIQKKADGKPLVVSEYGAEAVKGRPGTGKGTEAYQAELVTAYARQLGHRPKTLGTMYWPASEFMLTPEGGGGNPVEVRGFHNKGLMTWFREPKKAYGVLTGS